MANVMQIRFDKNSMRLLEQRLMETTTGVQAAATLELLKVAEEILTWSDQIVPVDTGALRNSKYISEPVKDEVEDTVSVDYGYGGVADTWNADSNEMASSYMVAVHEDLLARHAPGKMAKYLEIPTTQSKKYMLSSLKVGLSKFFRTVGANK